MLKSIIFLKSWRCFKEHSIIEFRPGVNLLVGDQGTGKSSLFQAIQVCGIRGHRNVHLPKDVPAIIDYEGEPIESFAFDFERDNYRTKSYFNDAVGFHIASMKHSHGEMVTAILNMLLEINKPKIILVDEPDMALSIRSCYRLIKIFQHIANQGGQVFATIHNPIVIAGFEKVYSLEHCRWISSQEFIKTQSIEGAPDGIERLP